MFNPLETNKQDVEQLFELSGEEILINDKSAKGIITLEQFMRETEDRNLQTLDKVTTGDVITYQNEYYLIINEIITKRHYKYKALMRHCNFILEFENILGREIVGYDEFGRPKYENIYGDPYIVPAIVSEKTFSIDNRYALRVGDDKITMTVQDNEITKENLKVSEILQLMETGYRVIHRDKTTKGLTVLTLESTTIS